MRSSLAIAAAAIAGALLGYYVSGERPHVTAAPAGRTVTKTVIRTVAGPDRRAGKRLFVAACSRCHTLDPRDLTGDRVNLAALQPSFPVTVQKVRDGGIAMPSFKAKLSDRQIRDVAAFVTAEAARRVRNSR
jgi:mono/diheme cytochrome c family protein